jgi:hypothetical protein
MVLSVSSKSGGRDSYSPGGIHVLQDIRQSQLPEFALLSTCRTFSFLFCTQGAQKCPAE